MTKLDEVKSLYGVKIRSREEALSSGVDYIVCRRTDDLKTPVRGAVTDHCCACNQDIWLSPSSFTVKADHICDHCAVGIAKAN